MRRDDRSSWMERVENQEDVFSTITLEIARRAIPSNARPSSLDSRDILWHSFAVREFSCGVSASRCRPHAPKISGNIEMRKPPRFRPPATTAITPSGRMIACFAASMTAQTAITCKTIFVFPSAEAGIVNPSADAMLRSPRTTISRPMMITAIQPVHQMHFHQGNKCGRHQKFIRNGIEQNSERRHFAAPPGIIAVRPVRGRRREQESAHPSPQN